jgi:ApaG protein
MIESLFPYALETRSFIVRVAVNYMQEQSEPGRNLWFWAYHIRIENKGGMTAQLVTRHWEINDARGMVQLVDGEGVVGDQPIIKPGASYDYVSGCNLTTPRGAMVGSYQMLGEDGSRFDIAIPRFDLAAPVVKG